MDESITDNIKSVKVFYNGIEIPERIKTKPKLLKTKIDIVLFIKTIKGASDEELSQIVKEFKTGQFEVV